MTQPTGRNSNLGAGQSSHDLTVFSSRDNSYEPPPGDVISQMVEISAESRSTGTPDPLSQESLDGDLYAYIPECLPVSNTTSFFTAADNLCNGNSYQPIPDQLTSGSNKGSSSGNIDLKPGTRVDAVALGPITGDSYSSISGRLTSSNLVSIIDDFGGLSKGDVYESVPEDNNSNMTRSSLTIFKGETGLPESLAREKKEAENLGPSIGDSYASVQSRCTVNNIPSEDVYTARLLENLAYHSLLDHAGNRQRKISSDHNEDGNVSQLCPPRDFEDLGWLGGDADSYATVAGSTNIIFCAGAIVGPSERANSIGILCEDPPDAPGTRGDESYSTVSSPSGVTNMREATDHTDHDQTLSEKISRSNPTCDFKSSIAGNYATTSYSPSETVNVVPGCSLGGDAYAAIGDHVSGQAGTHTAPTSNNVQALSSDDKSNSLSRPIFLGNLSMVERHSSASRRGGSPLHATDLTYLSDPYAAIPDDEALDRNPSINY